ncbi:MAG: head GIN domain-containing protein [Saprospiraceae bacterium]|nr:DUF2807 domain-containing protein [Lewinella sp.]
MNEIFIDLRKLVAFLIFILLVGYISAQTGSGQVIEQERSLANFSFIDVEDGIDVYLTPGNTSSVMVKADDNLADRIITKVSGKVLSIEMDGSYRKAKKLEVHITLPELSGIEASGGSDVYSTQRFKLSDFKIELSGGSDIRFEMDAGQVFCNLSGGSDAELRGSVNELKAQTSGGSDLKAKDLEIKKCKLYASGGSDAYVWVKEELEMEASGASDIYYRGKPNITHQRASGASDIHPM